jgi:hypothetical protein
MREKGEVLKNVGVQRRCDEGIDAVRVADYRILVGR